MLQSVFGFDDVKTLLILLAGFLAAGLAKGTFGLGMPFFGIPVMTLAMPFQTALAMFVVPNFTANLQQMLMGGKIFVYLRRFGWLLFTMLASVPQGRKQCARRQRVEKRVPKPHDSTGSEAVRAAQLASTPLQHRRFRTQMGLQRPPTETSPDWRGFFLIGNTATSGQVAHVDQMPRDASSGRHSRAHEMRATALALTTFKIAVTNNMAPNCIKFFFFFKIYKRLNN